MSNNLTVGQRVQVNEKCKPSKTYMGRVVRNDLELANRACKSGPWVPHTYVQFDNDDKEYAYFDYLRQGSWLYCQGGRKCFVRDIEYDNSKSCILSMTVAEDDGEYNLCSTEFRITTGDIDSILVYYLGFDISRE